MSNKYTESYSFKYESRMLEVIILLNDNKPSVVQVYGSLDKYDKVAFNKVCLSINTQVASGIYDYVKHKEAIMKLNNVDMRIINFFERNIFALMKIE